MSKDLDTGLFGSKNCQLRHVKVLPTIPFALRLKNRVKSPFQLLYAQGYKPFIK